MLGPSLERQNRAHRRGEQQHNEAKRREKKTRTQRHTHITQQRPALATTRTNEKRATVSSMKTDSQGTNGQPHVAPGCPLAPTTVLTSSSKFSGAQNTPRLPSCQPRFIEQDGPSQVAHQKRGITAGERRQSPQDVQATDRRPRGATFALANRWVLAPGSAPRAPASTHIRHYQASGTDHEGGGPGGAPTPARRQGERQPKKRSIFDLI